MDTSSIEDKNLLDTYSSNKLVPLLHDEILYKYFLKEGKTWRIDIEHIQASLRRNNEDITKTIYDIKKLLDNKDIEIRTHFHIDDYGDDIILSKGLPGQEWQINLTEGTFILYNDEVYKLVYIHMNNISLEKIFGYNDYDNKYINIITDEEVILGKYMELFYPKIWVILEKDYTKIAKEYIECKDKKDKYECKLGECANRCLSNIRKIKIKCYNECSHEKKKEVLKDVLDSVYGDLETGIFHKMISDFGLKTECNHTHIIEENVEELEYIDCITEDMLNFKRFYEIEYIYKKANDILYGYLHYDL